jgi:hypothetical protein
MLDTLKRDLIGMVLITSCDFQWIFWQTESVCENPGQTLRAIPNQLEPGCTQNEWEPSLADRIFLDDSSVPRELGGQFTPSTG